MKIRQINVHPNLPEKIAKLRDLAMNMWFSWNWEALRLFIRLSPDMWEKSYQNPVLMLGSLSPQELQAAAADDAFVADLERLYRRFTDYLGRTTWFQQVHHDETNCLIGYFSAEFGIDEGLPIYSGGLGILAGDHLKSSSDLGIPLVGVGLLYQKGYLRQILNLEGWQREGYPLNDWYNMSVRQETGPKGEPLTIAVDYAGTAVRARIWSVSVGRNRLILLDTNIPENPLEHRAITDQLYGGDRDMRIRQEILLGIGGARALKALGIEPTVYHMNEGHSAFMALERIRDLMVSRKLNFTEAKEVVWATNVFTTHTSVPAGNEIFELPLMEKYFSRLVRDMGLSWQEFLALGQDGVGGRTGFCLTILALRLAAFANGVSQLHGTVTRKLWSHLWENLPAFEVPITHITNGIHTRSWISHDMSDLLERYLGPKFVEEPGDEEVWSRVDRIPESELWRVHQDRRERLVFFARKRLKKQLARLGAGPAAMHATEEALNPRVLTIGFARRFTAYKRANLLLRNPRRLVEILKNKERPVQLIFAGKAHPMDIEGKEMIKKAVNFANDPEVAGQVVFLEDYDINVARYLMQGVDVWINTPRRPLEASGTSGMKAAANGALNLSVLDGWWCEGYSPDVGWSIGAGEEYNDPAEQDNVESEVLYKILEREVAPLFYERDKSDLPRQWIAMMKASIQKLAAHFNSRRMVRDYVEEFYLPAHRAGQKLLAGNAAQARALSAWRETLAANWSSIELSGEPMSQEAQILAGDHVPVRVKAKLGKLNPEDVAVQVYYGVLDAADEIASGTAMDLDVRSKQGDTYVYGGEVFTERSGRYGFTFRAIPRHPELVHPYTPLMLTWER